MKTNCERNLGNHGCGGCCKRHLRCWMLRAEGLVDMYHGTAADVGEEQHDEERFLGLIDMGRVYLLCPG